MKQVRQCKIQRTISWEGNSTSTTISISDYLLEMRRFGQLQSRTTASSRKYLRSLGMEIDKKGYIVVK